MGRTALPASVHALQNNASKLPASEISRGDPVRLPFEIPDCPRHLNALGKQEWNRITPLLVTAGLLTQLDRAAAAAYCQAWGEWAAYELKIKALQKNEKSGADALIDVTPSGYKQISALAQVRDRACDRMLRFAKEFGLTPSSRIQSTTGQQMALPGVPDDPMEGFLNAGSALPLVH